MSLIKCQGVVIKSINIGESDKIITLLTDKAGKVDVLVRGVRRPKSRYVSGAQPFCYGEYLIYKGRSLYTLNDCTVIESFQNLIMDLEKIAYGSYFLELMDFFNEKEVKNIPMLALLLKVLYIMLNSDINLKLLKLTVGFKVISIAGYMPQLYSCVRCSEKLKSGYFSIVNGGMTCDKCRPEKNYFAVNESVWNYLHVIKNIKLEDLRNINCKEDMLNYLDNLIFTYIRYHVDKEFKSITLLEKI